MLLRSDDDLVAIDADGVVFADFEGRRRIIRGDAERNLDIGIPDIGRGPYRLEAADHSILAISP